jgi:putative SOS response-associated peptidase YedK
VCGRYSLAVADDGLLRQRFAVGEAARPAKRFNICPGDDVLAVTAEGGAQLRWGLDRAINARAETAAQTFAGLRRVLLPADGFFEWHGGRPHHIAREDGAPFALAGLATRERAVVVTCAPSPVVAALHDRMPLILEPEDEAAWLDPAVPVEALARPFVALRAREVSRALNDPRHDGPDVLDPPAQPALF